MKKLKALIIMLIVLVLLVMVYLVASPMWSEDTGEETTEEPTHTVAVIDHTVLVGLELTSGGETLSFALNDAATEWDWSEDGEVPLDNVAFAAVVTAFNEAGSKYKLENVTDDQLAEYGLAEAAVTVKFTFSDGTSKEYKIGNLNSFNGLYYLSESGAPNTVYMVDASVVNSLELDIYDFVLEETPPAITEAKILGVTSSGMASVDSIIGGEYRMFTYYPAGNDTDYTDRYNWYFGTQRNEISSSSILTRMYPLKGDHADTLSDLVTGLSFDECVGLDYTDGEYGFSEGRQLVIHYNADENETGVLTKKEYVIYLGAQREDGGIYAHTADSKLVYILGSSDKWTVLLNSAKENLMPDEIWLPNYERVNSLTFTVGENTLTVNVKNTDGKISYSSDTTDDSEALTALLESLDGLKATSNVAYFEDDAAYVEPSVIFTVKVSLNTGDAAELDMTVERYSMNYCKVSFNGREDQLISLEDAEKIADMISAFFAEETKAA